MANKTFTLNVQWTGDHYEVTIPEIEATATGTTFDEAIDNGHRAIIAAEAAKLKAKRLGKQTQPHHKKAS